MFMLTFFAYTVRPKAKIKKIKTTRMRTKLGR